MRRLAPMSSADTRTGFRFHLAARVADRYALSKHEQQIRDIFDGRIAANAAGGSIPARPAILICFTNRSGSNYLAQLLETTGAMNRAREFFNWPFVDKLSRKHDIASLPDYCRYISEAFRPEDRYWAAKVGVDQLRMLLRTGVIPQIYHPVRLVFVERRDLLAQAISLSIARQTRRWTTLHRDSGEEPKFDPDDIHLKLDRLKKGNTAFKYLFTTLGAPVHVLYEDLCDDPVGTVRQTLESLDLKPVDPCPERCSLRIQRTDRNKDYKQRWLQSFNDLLHYSAE